MLPSPKKPGLQRQAPFTQIAFSLLIILCHRSIAAKSNFKIIFSNVFCYVVLEVSKELHTRKLGSRILEISSEGNKNLAFFKVYFFSIKISKNCTFLICKINIK